MKNSKTYEHINPEVVGNHRRVLISDLSGRSNILYKTKELGIKIKSDNPKIGNILSNLKTLENEGYEFEGADASFEILVKKSIDKFNKHFELISARTISEKRAEDEDSLAEATVIVRVDGITEHTAAIGNGPINALDKAFRKILSFTERSKAFRLQGKGSVYKTGDRFCSQGTYRIW